MKKRGSGPLMPCVSTRRDQAVPLTNAQRNLQVTTQTRTDQGRTNAFAIAAGGFAAIAVATAAVVAVVALSGAGKGSSGHGYGDGGVVVPPPTASPSGAATPRPSAKPSATPTTAPIPSSKPASTRIRIATVNDADVTVDIVDKTARVTHARSGPAIEGVSVDYDRLLVKYVDPRTLRLTWSDYPMDNALTLFVSQDGGRLRLVLVRPGPSGTTDAIAFDRQLLLTFASPIDASDIDQVVQDGLDTVS